MGKNIKTLRRFLALVMAFGVVAGLCACTQQSSSSAPPSATSSESQTPDAVVAEWPDFLTVGGGSTGGVFFSAAAGIAQLLSSETDTTATAQTSTGGSQNIQLIANGEMELGIAAADACYQAWNGIGSYEKPLQEMNVICAIYSSYYQHVVRNDSKAQSFEEMAGSTQVVGGSGSGTEVSARAVLGAYGYDYLERKDLKAEFLGISEGVEKIQNKQADGMNSITPYPFSSFVELTMTDNAHLISINDEALDKLVNAEGSVYMKGIIPAGTYNNQNEDTDKMISCHLGGSCSLCAIDEGKSVDTTFGLSLQNGICHANRCGDLDVYVFPFLNNRGYSNAEILQGLEKEGGLLGISGVSNDMRELREAAASGNERAQLAINHFVNGIVKYIGAFYAELGGLDNLVFTGGIGENDDALRTAVCQQLAHLGVELADNSEVDADGTRVISAANSRVRVVVIPANEELGVARKTYQAIS